MIRKHKIKLAYTGLLFITIVLCLTFFNLIKNNKQQSLKYADTIEELRSRVLLHSRFSGHIEIPENNKLKTIKGDLQYFTKVFSELNIVLYINSNQCDSCINDAIDKVEKYLKKHPEFNYIIISKGFNLRELKLMRANRNIHAEIYSLINNKIAFFNRMDEVQYPYYFLVNKSLEVSNVFFPIKSSSTLEDRYFKQVSRIE